MSKPTKKVIIGERKRALTVKCYKCKQKVDSKNTVLCSLCRNYFEFDCIGYSEKLHHLKDANAKKNWKCKSCCKSAKETSTPNPLSYVTQRKKGTISQLNDTPSSSLTLTVTEPKSPKSTPVSLISKIDHLQGTPSGSGMSSDIDELQSQTLNTSVASQLSFDSQISNVINDSLTQETLESIDKPLSKSLDCTITDPIPIQEMKETISLLRSEYAILQNEFDNTSLENNNLRQQINKLAKENDMLKSLCQSPLNDSLTSHCSKKSNRCVSTAKTAHLDSSLQPLYDKIKILQKQLKFAEKEILKLKEYISSLEQEPLNDSQDILGRTKSTNIKCCRHVDDSNRIFIFGTQRCVGLSAAILRSREDTQYEKYVVTAETKPYALSPDVLCNVNNLKMYSSDKIIICIGENDYDKKITTTNLRRLIKRFIKHDIIVLNILSNRYLNVTDLNQSLKEICNEYQNCHYINCNSRSVFQLAKSINYVIDCFDYERNYLNPKQLRKYIVRGMPTTLPRKNISNGSHIVESSRLTQTTLHQFFPRTNKNNSFRASMQ